MSRFPLLILCRCEFVAENYFWSYINVLEALIYLHCYIRIHRLMFFFYLCAFVSCVFVGFIIIIFSKSICSVQQLAWWILYYALLDISCCWFSLFSFIIIYNNMLSVYLILYIALGRDDYIYLVY